MPPPGKPVAPVVPRSVIGTAPLSDVPVGFTEIRLTFDLQSSAPSAQWTELIETTERYCVVFQTLAAAPRLRVEWTGPDAPH